jgi:hypothetical protein
MMMRTNGQGRAAFTAAVFGLFACGGTEAAPFVQEGFNYSLISPVNGAQTGGVGFAPASSWGSVNANIVAGLSSLGYASIGSGAFQVTSDSRIQRALASSFGGSTFYVSMLINTYGVNGARFGVELRSAEGPLLGRVINGWGIFAGQNGKAGISNSTGDYKTWTGVTALADSLPHLLVFKFDYAANAIKLYVDPLPALGEPAVPSATLATGGDWTVNLNSDTWNAISFYRQSGANETIDEIRLGTAWADVAPVDPVATTTDAWWTNVTAASGAAWGDANNWANTAGANVLPGPNSAFLTLPGSSYTALYDSVQPAISNLTVQNVSPYRTDVVVSAPLTSLGGAAVRLRAGSSVTVTNGGVWAYAGTNAATDGNESMLSLSGGGELNIGGGVFAFTNLPIVTAAYANHINVGYGSTGTLRVTSGRFDYFERTPRATTNANRTLFVGRGAGGDGTLEVSGGVVNLGRADGGAVMLSVGEGVGSGTIGATRGKVVVSGGALLGTNNTANGWNLMRVGFNYGVGTFIVTNSGIVRLDAGGISARAVVGVGAFASGLLRMDGGSMTVGDGLTVGDKTGWGWSTGVLEVTSGTLNCGAGLVVGLSETASLGGDVWGQVAIGGGRVTESYWGVFVGRARVGGSGFGRMAITNGLLDIVSSAVPAATGNAPGGGEYSGLAVGVVNLNEVGTANRARGELTVSGSGVITNAGVFVFGVNGGTGIVAQTGGKIVHAPTGSAEEQARKMTVLGYGVGTNANLTYSGGNGSYEISGGSFLTPSRVFVGGVPTGVQSYSRAGGVGLLKVTGGTFTVTNNTLTVGGYGTGTLTVGAAGVCFAKDIVFTNNTQSTLRCELDAAGLGTLKASGSLSIYPGAKLEVDASAYQGNAVWIKLADCATRTGSFAPSNITVTGPGVVKQDRDEDLWLFIQRGLMIGVQ